MDQRLVIKQNNYSHKLNVQTDQELVVQQRNQQLRMQQDNQVQELVIQTDNYHTLTLATPIIPDMPSSFDYETLHNKPKINGVEIDGDMSIEDFGVTSGDIVLVPLSFADIDELTP